MKIDTGITISRTTNSKSGSYIWIEIKDKVSGCRIIETTLTLEDFAMAITGMGHIPCTSEFFEDAPVGKKRQTKIEYLRRPPVSNTFVKASIAKEILEPYEIDDWKARVHDLWNPHHWIALEDGSPGVSVTFERWVGVDKSE
jgi:hypothetical protein